MHLSDALASVPLSRQAQVTYDFVNVTDRDIRRAHNMRAQRDGLLTTERMIFTPPVGDVRWIGELGELIFDYWLRDFDVAAHEYRWIMNGTDILTAPDFIVHGVRISIKTVQRVTVPRAEWTCSLAEKHMKQQADEIFWLNYDVPKQRMCLLGGIAKSAFVAAATHHKAGERIHAHYVVHSPIWSIAISRLTPPREWLRAILTTPTGDGTHGRQQARSHHCD